MARAIMYGSYVLFLNNLIVTLRWVLAHKGVPGNYMADKLVKEAAEHLEDDVTFSR